MKKRSKMLLALLLALTMLVLSACGSQTEQQEVVEPTTEEVVETTEEVAEESAYPEYLNLDGYRPIVKEGEEITLRVGVVKNPSTTVDLDEMWFVNFIEEKLNVNLEIEPIEFDARGEKVNLVMASGDLPDIMFTYWFETNSIVKYGVGEELLLPISDYLSEELTPNIIKHYETNPEAAQAHTASDGKIYTIPQILRNDLGYGESLPVYRMFVDTKLLGELGYEEMPDDLDGFVQMLKDAKDQTGAVPFVSNPYDKVYMKNVFGWMTDNAQNDAVPVWDVEEGKIVVPVAQDKYKDYIKFWNMLYTEGLIDPDYFTLDDAAKTAMMAERTSIVWGTDAPYAVLPEQEGGWEEFSGIGPLKSQWNPKGAAMASSYYATAGYCNISADTEYPELCLRLLDYMCSEEGLAYNNWGAPAGSEDTLGMIDGYTIVDGKIDYGTQDDSYDSTSAYRLNNIVLLWQALAPSDPYAFELAGEEYVVGELDLNNGDQHYRYTLATACEGKLVAKTPPVYMDEKTSERFLDLQTVINDYVQAEFAKFVVGQRSLDELDAFQAELQGLNMDEYMQLCEEAYANYAGPQ